MWKKCPSYPGYEASDEGKIRNAKTGYVLNPWLRPDGYLQVSLSIDGKHLRHQAHRVVADAFHGPPPFNGATVAHGDGTKTNNVPGNLRWATMKENHHDRVAHLTDAVGIRNGRSILTEDQVKEIRKRLANGEKGWSLADDYDVSPAAIYFIRNNTTWRHVD